jgi:hypothetical protein
MSSPNHAAQHSLIITAFGCLENIPSIPQELIGSLRKQSRHVIPPRSMDEATAFSSAGEFGLALFAEQITDSSAEMSRLIRTASLVGGRDALQIIRHTVMSARPATLVEAGVGDNFLMHDAITSAWLRFDAELYARTVISGSSFAKSLQITNPELLGALRHVRGIESLQLGQGCSLDAVGILPDLKSLTVEDIPDISPVARYESLIELRLDGVTSSDLTPLSELTKLEILEIGFPADLKINFDATPLRKMRRLRRLVIRGVHDCDVTALERIRPEVQTSGTLIRDW